MNEYTYEQIETGMEESFQVTVTEEMMRQFLAITGDANPLHTDPDYALSQNYDNKVVYGMLTASFYSTLAGMYLPGRYSLIHSVESKFLRPVYVGDTLTVSGVVKEKEDAYHMLILTLLIRNQKNEKISKGTMQVMVLHKSCDEMLAF
jgi:acyl dehydratase